MLNTLAEMTMPEGPWWVQMLYAVVVAVVGAFASPYLLRKAAEAKAMAADASLSARAKLTALVKEYCLLEAANFAEKRFAGLATWVIESKPNKEEVKARLRVWGDELRTRAIAHFALRNCEWTGLGLARRGYLGFHLGVSLAGLSGFYFREGNGVEAKIISLAGGWAEFASLAKRDFAAGTG